MPESSTKLEKNNPFSSPPQLPRSLAQLFLFNNEGVRDIHMTIF